MTVLTGWLRVDGSPATFVSTSRSVKMPVNLPSSSAMRTAPILSERIREIVCSIAASGPTAKYVPRSTEVIFFPLQISLNAHFELRPGTGVAGLRPVSGR